MARQRVSLTKFLVHVLGGKPYDGASMRHAHKGLGLTDVQFDVVLESLADALRTCGVCEAHIAQIAAVADSTRGDVLCRTPAAP
ncbi:hypothetical protein BC831DRAFT_466410 [Entophlyctis helioformis]|nr:hypothetical protein BC831DRAFT_466380 [Entophlyctis helioformis]KAI8924250.1 hypothetical protein BC831DRAFT_466410 [Entophlyctis helioformis]